MSKADGTVDVKAEKPWYRFVVVSDTDLRAEIENRLKNNPEINSYSHLDVSVSSHAKVAEMVIADLKAELNASTTFNN